jgi:uncharacterized protein
LIKDNSFQTPSPLGNANRLMSIEALHERVDTSAAEIVDRLGTRLRCGRGCTSCCVDKLTVFQIEADLIRHHFSELLKTSEPHLEGACAFLSAEGDCRIYPHRPYVCRTQGLPLRWVAEADENTGADEGCKFVEYRDICPLNEESADVTELPAEECWLIGPTEAELQELQAEDTEQPIARIALRDLFSESQDKPLEEEN